MREWESPKSEFTEKSKSYNTMLAGVMKQSSYTTNIPKMTEKLSSMYAKSRDNAR